MSPESPRPREALSRLFEENRARLNALARRMLGSAAEAEDAVQETWMRLTRAGAGDIENLGGWLTTVTARICLDLLRARGAHPETSLEDDVHGPVSPATSDAELLLADSMGPALVLVLDLLPPAERVAFVLHDLFAVPFEEIATILERSPEAARQLASRARRRLQNRDAHSSEALRRRRQGIVDAFLKASREGDFEALLAVLHPDAVLRADAIAVQVTAERARFGAPLAASEVRGARAVAEAFKGRATGAVRALVDGLPGAVWAPGGKIRSAFLFQVEGRNIAGIEMVMEPERLAALRIEIFP
jgi:RNA polymerase sigma factor (sigma-70 family)